MKNNRFFNLVTIFLISLLAISCNTETIPSKTSESSLPNFDDAELVELNPERNELAKLMLIMYAKTEVLKNKIENGSAVVDDNYLLDIEQITKVNNGIDSHSFDDFKESSEMLMKKAILLQETDQNQKKPYNNLINSCIVCHEHYCPKMVQKIEKLLIK